MRQIFIILQYFLQPFYCINRKEGTDQESIQLPNIFRSKTPKGKKDILKATAPQSKPYKQKAKRTVSSPKTVWTAIQNKKNTRTYNGRNSKPHQKHRRWTVSKNITLCVRGGVCVCVWCFNRFYVATTLALSSAVVYTKHLFSLREGFLTRQRNISENIKIKRIQRWNNDEDSTARNNWNAAANVLKKSVLMCVINKKSTSKQSPTKLF